RRRARRPPARVPAERRRQPRRRPPFRGDEHPDADHLQGGHRQEAPRRCQGQGAAPPGVGRVPVGLPLRRGDGGDGVRDLQVRLSDLGYDVAPDEPGTFTAGTERAVEAFQGRRGLRVDGICGSQTWSTVVEAGYRPGDRLLYYTSPLLRGDDVADLQRRLGALGFDAGRVDGIFGPDAQGALLDFQRNAGLTTDAVRGRLLDRVLGRRRVRVTRRTATRGGRRG